MLFTHYMVTMQHAASQMPSSKDAYMYLTAMHINELIQHVEQLDRTERCGL